MAARVGNDTVMAPGTLVISAYAFCPDITATVSPDLKCPGGRGALLWVALNPGRHRLGGSALAQVYSQIGDSCPDLDDPKTLTAAFRVTQELLKERAVTAGHDVSDGGLLSCALEMAFAGNCGLSLRFSTAGADSDPLALLFAEEPGLLLEVREEDAAAILERYGNSGVSCSHIGTSGPIGPDEEVSLSLGGAVALRGSVGSLRALWEETSFQLERLQTEPRCVAEEEKALKRRQGAHFSVSFPLTAGPPPHVGAVGPRVAVLREEGSNGDREMAAAFHMAQFEVWDVTTEDLRSGAATLDGG